MNVQIKLDLIQTVAFAGAMLFLGYGLRRLVPPLARVKPRLSAQQEQDADEQPRHVVERG